MSDGFILAAGNQQITCDRSLTLLENIQRAGFRALSACRNAACGICRAKIRRGNVHYKQEPRGLSEAERAQGFCLPCAGFSDADLELEWAGLQSKDVVDVRKISCQVQSVTPLNTDTYLVSLVPADGSQPQYAAGQYLQLIMPDGSPRSFSIASAPESQLIDVHIKVIPGHERAQQVIDHVRRRRVVTVELPFGECHLPDNEHPLLMIAGGTGFAPMKSLIESSLARHETRDLWLYWGAANKSQLYWHEQMLALSTQHLRLHYVPVLAMADEGWYGATGFPHLKAADDHGDFSAFEVFCSGSEGMARAVYAFMQAKDVPDHRFHCDWIDILRNQGAL